MTHIKNIVGQRFGRLVAIEPTKERDKRQVVWACVCDCGNFHKATSTRLQNGNTKSCGCLREELRKARATTHGHAGKQRTPEYCSYLHAKKRCNNPNTQNYQNYGGRGIEFRFQSFEEFFAELGPKPEPKDSYSIDRIDNDGHYEPGNVRWATIEQQRANRRDATALGQEDMPDNT